MFNFVISQLKKYKPIWRRIKIGVDAYYRVSMSQLGNKRPKGVAGESAELVQDTDKLNVAAEHYFSVFEDREFLLNKPFSDSEAFGRHLFSLGVVFTSIGLTTRDVVVEFGAGTCWVSHFLNRFGCRTISIDVSQTALDLGRETFQRDPSTIWSLAPEFLRYDGHTLPLPDACCDKIIIIDAFHHIPNQREILSEMYRILKPQGVIGMSEPGLGHASSDASRHEVDKYGVLENELVIEDLGALAKSVGFKGASIVVASPDGLWELPTDDLEAFMKGKNFLAFWQHQCNALQASHYVLLHKGDPGPTTQRPKVLRAEIEVEGVDGDVVAMKVGTPRQLTFHLTNPAETRWLSSEGEGWTRLGAHLYKSGEPRSLVDFDWLRAALPGDVGKDREITVTATLPAIDQAGSYEAVFDLVIEGTAWFASKGSAATTVRLVVSP